MVLKIMLTAYVLLIVKAVIIQASDPISNSRVLDFLGNWILLDFVIIISGVLYRIWV